MKSLNTRLKVIALSAAALLCAAAPASAASLYYQKYCTFTWSGLRCSYRPVSVSKVNQPVQQGFVPTSTKTTAAAQPATTAASGLTAQEQQMLNLVNGERAKHGLAPLKADLQLTKLARMKSQDMISHNYFSHNSPTYGSPFQMMQRYGVSYKTAGENIAGNGSVASAHQALMNSPGHRANILKSGFTHVGIGVVSGGRYGMMFTQMFVGR